MDSEGVAIGNEVVAVLERAQLPPEKGIAVLVNIAATTAAATGVSLEKLVKIMRSEFERVVRTRQGRTH